MEAMVGDKRKILKLILLLGIVLELIKTIIMRLYIFS